MTPFPTLVAIEVRRALARRLVRVLVVLALVATTVMGVVVFATSGDFDPASTQAGDPARLTSLWAPELGDDILVVSTVLLAIGAVLGGASVTGAEWRAGTVSTWATWVPLRGRALLARLAAAVVVAAVISVLLQTVFVVAFLPAVLVNGTTAGANGAWFAGLLGGMGRTAVLVGLAAGVGASIASLGRNTSAALGAAFVYMAVVENLVRGLWPGRARWLIGENATIFVSGRALDHAPFSRSTLAAGLTLALYLAVLAAVAVEVFRRRDLAAGP